MARHVGVLSLLVGVAVCVMGPPAAAGQDAAETHWVRRPGDPGLWTDGGNWSAGEPTKETTAYITNGGTALIEWLAICQYRPAPAARVLILGGQVGGTVKQDGWALEIGEALWLGLDSPGLGNYALGEGRFSAGSVWIGAGLPIDPASTIPWPAWASRFVQTGGSSVIRGALNVGFCPYPTLAADPGAADAGQLLGGFDAEYWYRPGGLYELAGGDLSAGCVHVGYGDKGKFAQSGGVNTVAGGVYVGGGLNWMPPDNSFAATWYSEGTYSLSAGTLQGRSIHVGQYGRGRFEQSGGTAIAEGFLQVGGNWWWPLDWAGAGPGPDAAMTSVLPPNANLPPHGTYRMTAGDLSTGDVEIGVGGIGQFVQSGGVHKVARTMRIGGDPECWIMLNSGGSDGSVVPPPYPGPSWGSYALSAGDLRVAGRLQVGGAYWPRPLRAGNDPAGPSDSIIPPWPVGTFCQTGGSVDVYGTLEITGPGASYAIHRGSLNAMAIEVGPPVDATTDLANVNAASGRLSIGGREARVRIADHLTLSYGSRFDAVDGARIHLVDADFQNYSRRSQDLAGLDHLRMAFSGGPLDYIHWETFEVAGKDLGFVRQGFWNNFVLHTLEVGAEEGPDWLRLVDYFKNQPDSDRPEALYVRRLIVRPYSRLDLNGLHLYYLRADIARDATILNGEFDSVTGAGWTGRCDADLDGCVSFLDFLTVRANFGRGDADWLDGDTDADGDVDFADYLAVKADFGLSIADGGGNVPEPATLALLAIGAALTLRRRVRA